MLNTFLTVYKTAAKSVKDWGVRYRKLTLKLIYVYLSFSLFFELLFGTVSIIIIQKVFLMLLM